MERTPTGWLASGTLQRVPWGRSVAAVVALGSAVGETLVALLPTSGATTSTSTNLAGEPRDTLTFVTAPLPADAVAPAPAGVNADWLRRRGALVRAVQIAGGLEQILDLGVEYAQQRTQFGRPLGNFQVIQHQLVQLAGETSTARAAADLALRIVGGANEQFAIAAAKARASAAVAPAAAIAHQVHGAIGFTQEHRLQLSTRRLWAWRDEFGSEAYWNTQLGRMALDAGPNSFWPALAVSHVKQGE
ncbi:MAG: acyl-CoA dehydrogenase [Chloroflexi bacterium]|nr:MAG: acyl-CoA dehydrogenase [Chloroflexota bacterium]